MHCQLLCALPKHPHKRSLKKLSSVFVRKGEGRVLCVVILKCVRVLRLVYAMHAELFKCPRSEKDHTNAAAKLK